MLPYYFRVQELCFYIPLCNVPFSSCSSRGIFFMSPVVWPDAVVADGG